MMSIQNGAAATGYNNNEAVSTERCELCRGRKSRCDGAKPRCKLCADLHIDCVYHEPGIKLTAGEKLIMEDLDKMKVFLQATLGGNGKDASFLTMDSQQPSRATTETHENNLGRGSRGMDFGDGAAQTMRLNPLAVSTSGTGAATPVLDLLRWPKIRDLVLRPYDPQSLLYRELAREPLQIDPPLSLDLTDTAILVQAFFERVNIWYACVDPHSWSTYYEKAKSLRFREGPESCVVLLVLALGSASFETTISQLPAGSDPPGMQYFSAAWGLLPGLFTSNTIVSSQCLVLAAAYLFYLVRPLEAWTLLSNVSTKLQLFIRRPGLIPEHLMQLSERIYWSTLLLETDLLSEFDLPPSGLAHMEDSIPLPTFFPSPQHQPQPPSPNDKLWYVHAAIDLRRLYTRITTDISSIKDPSSTPLPLPLTALEPLTHELEIQLHDWYETLPTTIRFPLVPAILQHPAQTVLRLRYFACRALIFRPYVLAVLENDALARQYPFVRENCRKCLESCVRTLEDVSVSHAGHLPYLYHSALCIVGMTLLVMGATVSRELEGLLPPAERVDDMLEEVVEEVERYAGLAPGLRVCGEVLRQAEGRRRVVLRKGGGS